MDYSRIIKYRNDKNPFAKYAGVLVTDMREGYAKAELEIGPGHMNPIGSVHGGCLYTLADVSGGAAAASFGRKLTTLNSSFEFLRPCINQKKLVSEAVMVKGGKRILVFEVKIRDDEDRLICMGTFSFMYLFDKNGDYIPLDLKEKLEG